VGGNGRRGSEREKGRRGLAVVKGGGGLADGKGRRGLAVCGLGFPVSFGSFEEKSGTGRIGPRP